MAAAGDRCPAHREPGRSVTLGDGTEAEVEAGMGAITWIDDRPHLCEMGMALRLGLADPTPEAAAQYFPIMELLPDEERPDPGEEIGGVPVFAWIGQQEAADTIKVSARHVQNLEEKGLPTKGSRASKRYPLPHVVVWHREYQLELKRVGNCRHLPFRLAWARHRLQLEEDERGGDL